MGLTKQMKAAEIRNWLTDLAIGAKAQARCVDRYSTYDNTLVDGVVTVHVHNLVELAEMAELTVEHREFGKEDFYVGRFTGEDFVMFNGVRFSDMILRKKVKKDV